MAREQTPDLYRLPIWRASPGRAYDEDIVRVGPFDVGTRTTCAPGFKQGENVIPASADGTAGPTLDRLVALPATELDEW